MCCCAGTRRLPDLQKGTTPLGLWLGGVVPERREVLRDLWSHNEQTERN